MSQIKKEATPSTSSQEHLNFRLIVAIPVVFVLFSLSAGLLAMGLTQYMLHPPMPTSRDLLLVRLWIVGTSLATGLAGGMLAYAITRPVRRAIWEARKMIGYVEPEPAPIKASNEMGALSAVFDQAYVSFIELVQARQMLDNVNEGIIAVDNEGRIAGMNLRAQEALEVSLPEVRQKSITDLWGSIPTNSVLLGIIQVALREQKERIHNRVPFCPLSGKMLLLSVKISPLRLKGHSSESLGAVVTFTEQTDRSTELPEIVGRSERFAEVLDLVAKVAPTDSTVLLLGESGTGKELIADAIHRLSQRRDQPLIKLNCTAIPEGLLESELFGHERGAFTGASRKKPGKFELADGGTIFLDEIGDMSPSTQAKVLRVLQEKEFTPVGGEQVRKVDVRIIAATNKDLPLEVQQGRFREDLFFRLNVITINIPPLRQRKSDIPFLADHFLAKTAERGSAPKKSLSRAALDSLLGYYWPGNVRELENIMERASLLANASVIQPEDLTIGFEPLPAKAPAQGSKEGQSTGRASLNETLEAIEKEMIIQALKKSNGVQVEAAKLLGLKHKNLWNKIRKHNIDPVSLRES